MKINLIGEVTLLVYVESEVSAGPGWKGRLYAVGTEQSWRATSGPHGKGAAPKGEYLIHPPESIEANEENKAFTDAFGLAWFAKMQPRFQTDREGLGIHPDGNVPGTLGCIGVAEKDTKDILAFLRTTPKPVVLYVL